MADTYYTYSIANDFPNSKVWSDLLQAEIKADPSLAAKYVRVDTEPDSDKCDVIFSSALDAGELTSLGGIVGLHSGEEIEVPDIDAVAYGVGYVEEEYNSKGFLLRRTRFADTDANGTLAYKIDEELFSYQGNILQSHTYKKFDIEGNEVSVSSSIYESEKVGSNTIIRRKKELN